MVSFAVWFRLSKGLQNYRCPGLKKKEKILFFRGKKKKLCLLHVSPGALKLSKPFSIWTNKKLLWGKKECDFNGQ